MLVDDEMPKKKMMGSGGNLQQVDENLHWGHITLRAMQGDVVDHDVAELDEDLGAQWLCERVRDHVGSVRGAPRRR